MKTVFIILLTCLSLSVFGQTSDSLEISTLKAKVANLERQIGLTNRQIQILNDEQKAKIDSLNNLLSEQTKKLKSIETSFNKEIGKTNSDLNTNVASLNQTISANKLFAIVGIVVAIILLIVVGLILWKKIGSKDSDIDKIKSAQKSLENVQKSMQEESVKLDSKLVELLEKQMTSQPVVTESKSSEPDHSLALKVADEIIRIETNLSKMDSSVKGYKQLSKAVERIRANFMANGYEIVDMLNKPYNEGMKAIVNFVSDESLADGEQKITGIIKPQINYQGKLIQSAQITVSQNI